MQTLSDRSGVGWSAKLCGSLSAGIQDPMAAEVPVTLGLDMLTFHSSKYILVLLVAFFQPPIGPSGRTGTESHVNGRAGSLCEQTGPGGSDSFICLQREGPSSHKGPCLRSSG